MSGVATIAFLGLGEMGSRMAARLLAAGHPLRVWNRTAARCAPLAGAGAVVAPTPRAAAAGADVAISMLRDDEACRAAWLAPETGALAGLATGALVVDCSTVSPGFARELATAVRDAGVAALDAPVAGSRPQADARGLVFLVGGEAADLARAEPLLLSMGAAAVHAGPSGAGATAKLAVNALLAVQTAAAAELVALLRTVASDPPRAMAAILATPVASPALRGAVAAMLARSHAPLFPLELAAKDLGYALALAGAAGIPVPMTSAAASRIDDAIAASLGDCNITALALLDERARPMPA
ncbi:NAD(P)-dependent oxidoreductase [Salinarimonas chemoclinalis]|uniref:NAD(P)-dependent oxidoreductase n=1 Tax=Salinarimonas chemoclinalis TaxID=3241599 RepID=UPI003558C504